MKKQLLYSVPRDEELMYGLFYLPDNEYTPYVIWTFRKDSPSNTFWGHYYHTREDAENYLSDQTFDDMVLYDVVKKLGGSYGTYEELVDEFRKHE